MGTGGFSGSSKGGVGYSEGVSRRVGLIRMRERLGDCGVSGAAPRRTSSVEDEKAGPCAI